MTLSGTALKNICLPYKAEKLPYPPDVWALCSTKEDLRSYCLIDIQQLLNW